MRFLITAGPTREPMDAVRYISNRSSGRMGMALAQAAFEAGHEVVLLLGPSCLEPPGEIATHRFESAAELEALLGEHFPRCDVLIMAAAVADYRPAKVEAGKPAREREGGMTLQLIPTPDLVAACAKRKTEGQRVIAFALEQADVLEPRARRKLARKGVDGIIANPLATMEAGTIQPVLLMADGRRLTPETPEAPETSDVMDKSVFARWLIQRVASLWAR